MEEVGKNRPVVVAAARAGMHRNTAAKYLKEGRLPSELRKPRTWRTRSDPFSSVWAELQTMLESAPELEAKSLLEFLMSREPGVYHPGQLRTLQRRLRRWRALSGPEKEVFFPQEHRPGEAMQTDFTWGTKLEVTIGGEPFPHLLCHPVLPYSNWEWVTVCHSESLAALKRGIQSALFQLGRVPRFHQTDNSTAATHDLRTGKRGFNKDYMAVMKHFDMKPRTIGVGASNQNGDVEALNGALKRRLKQHLLLRGSREFGSVEQYECWLRDKLVAANRTRQKRLNEDLDAMRQLQVRRLPDYTELQATVTSWSTIRVLHNTYSVPSRLMGEEVMVRVFDDHLEVEFGGVHQLRVDRLTGRHRHRINYRHIIWSLVQKPGAFERYRYRDELFPSVVFRRTYDTLCDRMESRKADLEYLRILYLAATTMESEVESALELFLEAGTQPMSRSVHELVEPTKAVVVPEILPAVVDLAVYDRLLTAGEVTS